LDVNVKFTISSAVIYNPSLTNNSTSVTCLLNAVFVTNMLK
jgi:hypothetical protein